MQRVTSRVVSLLLALSFALSAYGKDPVIRFYTEIAAPFYWLDENDQPQGASLELATAVADKAKLNATVEHLAWARAYYEATQHPNVVLISVLKTPARESEFQWLGLVHVARASFIRLTAREQLNIDSPEQARQYRVGTIRGYGAASYLKKQGFVENKNLFLATDPEQLWSMLYSQRIDLALSNIETDRYEIASIGLDPDKVTAIHNVEALNLQLQMATGLSTPEYTVESIRKALHQLKEDGEYERIMQKWGLL